MLQNCCVTLGRLRAFLNATSKIIISVKVIVIMIACLLDLVLHINPSVHRVNSDTLKTFGLFFVSLFFTAQP